METKSMEIRVTDLRVILERLCGSETLKARIKELHANDVVKLEVSTRQRLRVSIRSTGEIMEFGK